MAAVAVTSRGLRDGVAFFGECAGVVVLPGGLLEDGADWSDERARLASSMRATIPATAGLLMLVPDRRANS